jgi:hypothetical protein
MTNQPDFTARITEILTGPLEGNGQDRIYLNFNGYRLSRSVAASFANLIAQAAEDHYRPRVETTEQLDALPLFNGVVDRIGRAFFRTRLGWFTTCDRFPYEVDEIRLPARFVWSPGAGSRKQVQS